MVKDVSNLVYYLYRTPCSLAGTHRGRQDSSCLGPDLTLLEATADLRVLRKKDAELTDHSAPTIFYIFEKVSACAESVAAA